MSIGEMKPLALRVRLPYDNEDTFIERYGANVNSHGVFIATRATKPEGTRVHFDFILATGVSVLRGQGLVVQAWDEASGFRAGMAVRFDELEDASRSVVERILERTYLPGVNTPAPTSGPPGMRARQTPAPRDVGDAQFSSVGEQADESAVKSAASDRTRANELRSPGKDGTSEVASSADATDADAKDADAKDADATDADATDADAKDADATDGDATDGDATDGDATDGDATDGDAAGGDAASAPYFAGGGSLRGALASAFVRSSTQASNRQAAELPSPSESAPLRPSSTRVMTVIGLDVGTSSTRASVSIGNELRRLALDPLPAATRHAIAALRRSSPGVAPREEDLRELTSHLSSVRAQCARQLGTAASHAVLSLPASFRLPQRAEWRAAAHRAGWDVLRLIDEPAAAAVAFGRGRQLPRKRLLVVDLGSAITDVAIVQATGDDFELLASGGTAKLGGADFDEALLQSLRPSLPADLDTAELLAAMEKAKRALSNAETTTLELRGVRFELTRDTCDRATAPLVDRIVSTVESVFSVAGITPQSIDEVLLFGGQSRSPRVVERLASSLGKPVRSDEGMGLNLEGAAALGAALFGGGLALAAQGAQGLTFTGALNGRLSLGTRGGALHTLLESGTRLPAVKTTSFPIAAGTPHMLALFQSGTDAGEPRTFLGSGQVTSEHAGELHVHVSLTADGLPTLDVTLPRGKSASLPLDPSIDPDTAREHWPELRKTPASPQGFWARLGRVFSGR